MNAVVMGILLIAVVGLWWLLFVAHNDFEIERTRLRLFQLRDAFFDTAAEGLLPFESPAYGLTRTILNGTIRFTHEMSLTKLLVVWVMDRFSDGCVRDDAHAFRERLDAAIESLESEQAKKIVRQTLLQSHLLVLDHVRRTSLLLFCVSEPLVWLFKLNDGARIVFKKWERRLYSERLDAEAHHIGKLAV